MISLNSSIISVFKNTNVITAWIHIYKNIQIIWILWIVTEAGSRYACKQAYFERVPFWMQSTMWGKKLLLLLLSSYLYFQGKISWWGKKKYCTTELTLNWNRDLSCSCRCWSTSPFTVCFSECCIHIDGWLA